MTSVDLPEPGHAGDRDEAPERQVDVDVGQVVLAGAADAQPLLAGLPAHLGHAGWTALPGRYWPVMDSSAASSSS